ncbi:MAG: VacJ family lipoprotein, partial [Pseudomonadota bacterium]
MKFKYLALLGSLILLQGCAASRHSDDPNRDPLESFNRGMYDFNDGLDRHIMKPLAEVYVAITPGFMRTGVTNFFDNLGYINVIANDILQGKIEQGFSDLGRFGVNTTLGIGGLFDVATEMGIPKNDEDLGQT